MGSEPGTRRPARAAAAGPASRPTTTAPTWPRKERRERPAASPTQLRRAAASRASGRGTGGPRASGRDEPFELLERVDESLRGNDPLHQVHSERGARNVPARERLAVLLLVHDVHAEAGAGQVARARDELLADPAGRRREQDELRAAAEQR